jgi:hypothetical protein
VRPPSQQRALGTLFLCLTLAFAGVAIASAWGASGTVGRWIVAFAAAAIAAWFGSLAWRMLRQH